MTPPRTRSSFSCCAATRVFELDGDRVDAPAGTLVFAPPRTKRTASATEEGTTIIALEGTPGKAYEACGWELITLGFSGCSASNGSSTAATSSPAPATSGPSYTKGILDPLTITVPASFFKAQPNSDTRSPEHDASSSLKPQHFTFA
jgi:hypothetical protein